LTEEEKMKLKGRSQSENVIVRSDPVPRSRGIAEVLGDMADFYTVAAMEKAEPKFLKRAVAEKARYEPVRAEAKRTKGFAPEQVANKAKAVSRTRKPGRGVVKD
jgi:predicted component of type VI protein secretion system